jgi:hypothetical protein
MQLVRRPTATTNSNDPQQRPSATTLSNDTQMNRSDPQQHGWSGDQQQHGTAVPAELRRLSDVVGGRLAGNY